MRAREYARLQPDADFADFAARVARLEASQPDWSDADLARIDGAKVTVAGADHDEAVNLDVQPHLHQVIAGSRLVILSGVSHFAAIQDPDQFARAVEDFLAGSSSR